MAINQFYISFVIPALNEERHIGRLLQSILKFMSNVNYEIIVVDNGSSDMTLDISRNFNATILQNSRKTIAGLRNLGASVSSGQFLVFLDADIVLTTRWSKNISLILEKSKDKKVVTGSRCDVSLEPSWIENNWFQPMIMEKANYINSAHLIISRKEFLSLGGFEEKFVTGEDYEFCLRAKKNGFFIHNDPNLPVIHNGYPKNLLSFFRREMWHGLQDVSSLKSFFSSKVALVSFLYFFNIVVGLAILASTFSIPAAGIFFSINILFCLTATLYKKRRYSLNVFPYFFLFNFYFLARALSLVYRVIPPNTVSVRRQ